MAGSHSGAAGREELPSSVPAKMFSCVSGLDVPKAALRSSPYPESVILYLLMACVGSPDQPWGCLVSWKQTTVTSLYRSARGPCPSEPSHLFFAFLYNSPLSSGPRTPTTLSVSVCHFRFAFWERLHKVRGCSSTPGWWPQFSPALYC